MTTKPLIVTFTNIYGNEIGYYLYKEMCKQWPQVNDYTKLIFLEKPVPYVSISLDPGYTTEQVRTERVFKQGLKSSLFRVFGKLFKNTKLYNKGTVLNTYVTAPPVLRKEIELKHFRGYFPYLTGEQFDCFAGYNPYQDELYFCKA